MTEQETIARLEAELREAMLTIESLRLAVKELELALWREIR